MTRAEAHDPLSYDRGDVVRFIRDYADKDVARGEYLLVGQVALGAEENQSVRTDHPSFTTT